MERSRRSHRKDGKEAGDSAFTDYIRALEPGTELPSRDRFEAFWSLLRGVLAGEMRKRGLWHASPHYLGIYGRSGWADGEALEELLIDCYAFIIGRLRGLKAQLERRSDIEGLLFVNVRNFLHDTRKKYDPLGFRIFSILVAVTRETIAEGTLHVVEGDPKVRNDTLLAFSPRSDPCVVAEGESLGEHVSRWSDDLFPELIVAHGRGLVQVQSRLKAHVLGLGSRGVAAFRFGDLIVPFRHDLRARWSALWRHSHATVVAAGGESELESLARWARPDAGFEERESFQKLLGCVDEAIEAVPESPGDRSRLHQLWLHLRNQATETVDDEAAAGRPPSRRTIAKLLGIPRNRLPELLATLGRVIEACRGDTSGKTVVSWKQQASLLAVSERTKTS